MKFRDVKFTEERALFGSDGVSVNGCVFEEGESPLKESKNVKVRESLFRYKYPFWYCKDVDIELTTFFEMARAGIWYTENISMKDCMVEAPKNFRRCKNMNLENVSIPNAEETMWSCENIRLKDVNVHGPYFCMNSKNIRVEGLHLIGNYSFDGVSDMEIDDSYLCTKDAFWNSENVVVKNSVISGEYLGWNSKNLTLINCAIESLQGMCYIDNLIMNNCRLINTTLAFEYSDVSADIRGPIESVFNPKSGTIKADKINHLVIEKDKIDPSKTNIICDEIAETVDTPNGLW